MVTGGLDTDCQIGYGYSSCGTDTVSVYNETGWIEDLPPLNFGRSNHGCNSFVNQNNEVV